MLFRKKYKNLHCQRVHYHIQLWDGETNLFGNGMVEGISETGKMFIAGILEHAPAITAIANPSVNSYKRLVPGYEAPVYIAWGPRNRTTLIRVPAFGSIDKAAFEIRSPDPMANPYLLLSALIVAGMDGINRKLTPSEPRTEDVFELDETEREAFGIKTLPSTLGEALDALEKDPVLIEALGESLCNEFLRIKRKEWLHYANQTVTDWEWETYRNL